MNKIIIPTWGKEIYRKYPKTEIVPFKRVCDSKILSHRKKFLARNSSSSGEKS